MIRKKRKSRIKKHLMIGQNGSQKNTKENEKFTLNIGDIQNTLPNEQRQESFSILLIMSSDDS